MAHRRAIETKAQGSLFDWSESDRVNRFLRFANDYLRVPHGYGAGEPFRWAPTQIDWIRSFVENHITIVSIGRGNGKSSISAAMALWWALDPPEGDQRPEIIIVSSSKDQSRGGVFNTALAMFEDGPLSELGHYYADVNDPRIVFMNGASIKIRSAHAERLQGMIPSLMICDEIGAVNPKVWSTLVQSLAKRPGATLMGVGTPLWERGILYEIHERHQAGKMGPGMRYIRHGADDDADLDDVSQWRKANVVRAELNPSGWIDDLAVVRSATPDDEWALMSLAIWADVGGKPLCSPEQWEAMAGHTVDLEEWQDLGVFVAVCSDWERKSCAVVAASATDSHVLVQPTLVVSHQTHPVPVEDVLDAVTAVGDPALVLVSTGSQSGELVRALEDEGHECEARNVASPAKMAGPSDSLIRLVSDGQLRHDGSAGPYRAQMLGVRCEVGKEGPRFLRDDRVGERHDSVIATAVAAHAAFESPRVAVF